MPPATPAEMEGIPLCPAFVPAYRVGPEYAGAPFRTADGTGTKPTAQAERPLEGGGSHGGAG